MSDSTSLSRLPLRVEEQSDVRCDAEEWKDEAGDRALVLRFTGTVRPGSAGAPDADAMVAQVAAALAVWPCEAVIYDLSALDYRWGDGLVRVLSVPAPDAWLQPASAVVSGSSSQAGLRSLCRPEALFDAAEAAVRAALAEARSQRERADALEGEPMVLVISDRLAPARAAEVIAVATARALDSARTSWPLAAWLAGLQAVEVRLGNSEDLAWAGEQAHSWASRGEAVVLAPRLPQPDRLTSLRRATAFARDGGA